MAKHSVALPRISTTQAIVEHLKERILAGEFAPGTMLPGERELKEQLGVSRLAVREGLARLSALGIISVVHGKGAFVSKTASMTAVRDALTPILPRNDFARLKDMLQARALIEGEQAASAAARCTDADIRGLEEILRSSQDVAQDPQAYSELDLRFHRQVAHIAGNPFLTLMWEALAFHIRGFFLEFAKDPGTRLDAIGRHRPLVEAMAAHNPDEARRLSHTHLDACLKHYQKRIASGEQDPPFPTDGRKKRTAGALRTQRK